VCDGAKKSPKYFYENLWTPYRGKRNVTLIERTCKMARFPRTEPEVIALSQAACGTHEKVESRK
jgi:hypothetical protein